MRMGLAVRTKVSMILGMNDYNDSKKKEINNICYCLKKQLFGIQKTQHTF
jgi:hypothetical protein